MKHGVKGIYSVAGGATNAYTRGLYKKYSANGICLVEVCGTNAEARGMC